MRKTLKLLYVLFLLGFPLFLFLSIAQDGNSTLATIAWISLGLFFVMWIALFVTKND